MFIFTAKFSRKKAIVTVLILAAVLVGIILVAGYLDRDGGNSASISTAAKNNAERVEFLKSYGWELQEEPIEEQEIVIPKEFNEVYTDYNEIQLQQNFDLTDYQGMDAVRYTYKILNYPSGDDSVVADIIVCKGKIIAGDVQSAALNGFMHGLDFPK